MDKAILPTEYAHEPDEGARDPMAGMSPHQGHFSSRKLLTFSEDTDLCEKSGSQTSYKEVLSQPGQGLTHRQKLLWLQKRRRSGLWAQCDDCERWRFLPKILDRNELPNKWYCRMNPDLSNASCSVPETPIRLRDEEDLIHSLYSAGSVVWARLPGWPWWPAMVDDCPDTEQFYWLDGFSDIPTHYNVVFFDSTEVTRAWIDPDNLKPYISNTNLSNEVLKIRKYKIRLQSAMEQADDAAKLALAARLGKYSFIAQFKGNINSPAKVTKKDLIRHQKKMKRKYNIELPIECGSDEDVEKPMSPMKKRNMIILGTPKRDRVKTSIRASLRVAITPIVPTVPRVEKETGPVEPSVHVFNEPDSMVVQVGSTGETVQATESYDNDTSKTYVPDYGRRVEKTDDQTATEMGTEEFQKRAATPNSDDFDFN